MVRSKVAGELAERIFDELFKGHSQQIAAEALLFATMAMIRTLPEEEQAKALTAHHDALMSIWLLMKAEDDAPRH